MLRSYESERLNRLKPEDDLQNISFFDLGKSYDIFSTRRPTTFQCSDLTGWSEKDEEQLLNFTFYRRQEINNRKKLLDDILKRNSDEKVKMNKSLTLQSKKVDQGAKVNQSITKCSLKTKNKRIYSATPQRPNMKQNLTAQNKPNHSQKQQQNKLKIYIPKFKEILKYQPKPKNPERKNELLFQAPCNIINFPISTVLIRKRQFKKKLEDFHFNSLALRIYK